MKTAKRTLWTLAAAAVIAAGAGCSSHGKAPAHQDADSAKEDALLVRMALAQNVHNGIAAESTVYPADFDPFSARLSDLGVRRVRTLIDAGQGGSGKIVVLQGAASDDLYSARVGTIRQAIADAGASLKQITVVKGTLVPGEPTSSGRTLLAFEKMLASYTPKQEGQQSQSSSMLSPTDQSNSSQHQ